MPGPRCSSCPTLGMQLRPAYSRLLAFPPSPRRVGALLRRWVTRITRARRAEEMLAAARRIIASVAVPVTVDFEAGYLLEPHQIADRIIASGAAGLNLEDSDHHGQSKLVNAARHAERLAAVKAAGTALLVSISFLLGSMSSSSASEPLKTSSLKACAERYFIGTRAPRLRFYYAQ